MKRVFYLWMKNISKNTIQADNRWLVEISVPASFTWIKTMGDDDHSHNTSRMMYYRKKGASCWRSTDEGREGRREEKEERGIGANGSVVPSTTTAYQTHVHTNGTHTCILLKPGKAGRHRTGRVYTHTGIASPDPTHTLYCREYNPARSRETNGTARDDAGASSEFAHWRRQPTGGRSVHWVRDPHLLYSFRTTDSCENSIVHI